MVGGRKNSKYFNKFSEKLVEVTVIIVLLQYIVGLSFRVTECCCFCKRSYTQTSNPPEMTRLDSWRRSPVSVDPSRDPIPNPKSTTVNGGFKDPGSRWVGPEQEYCFVQLPVCW